MFDDHIIQFHMATVEHTPAAIDAAELRHLMANAQISNDHDLRAQIITYRLTNSI